MKKIYPLIASLFICSAAIAQNWSPLNLTDKYNYRLDNDPVVTQTVWQTGFTVAASDTTFSFNTRSCDSCVTINANSTYGEKNLPRFFGYTVTKTAAGICNFRNPGSKTLEVLAPLNASWLFDTLNNVNAQMIASYTGTVFGIPDSLKTILLSTGDTIRLSKNFGITQWPNAYSSNSYYRLVGIHGRNIGELVPRTRDYFDFNIGDVFQYRSWYMDCGSPGTLHDCVRKYTVMSLQQNADTLIYHVSGILADNWVVETQTPWTYGHFYGNISYDITVVDSAAELGNFFNNELPEEEGRAMAYWCGGPYGGGQNIFMPIGGAFEVTHLFKDSLGIPGIAMGWKQDMSYSDILNSQWSNISPQYAPLQANSDTLIIDNTIPTSLVVMKKGLGQVAASFTSHFESAFVEHLEAYSKNGDTTGVLTPDDVLLSTKDLLAAHSFSVYPNPASSEINLDLSGNSFAEVQLLDVSGRSVQSFGKMSGHNLIPVASLASGIYFLQVVMDDSSSQQKIIITH